MACRERVGRSPLSVAMLRVGLVALALTGPTVLSARNLSQDLATQQRIPEFDRQVAPRDDVPAHVAIVDGAASLEREGRREVLEENTLLLAGDRLRTERGRVEVLFDDGSVLDVDEFSTMDLLSDSLMRLTAGRIRLAIARVTNTLSYRVDAAGTTSWIQNAGEYRIAIRDGRAGTPEVELSVFRGDAELETPHGRTRVRTGAQAFAVSTGAPSQTYAVNVAVVDDFDRWTESQREARLGVDSSQYLPPELRYYGGALDDNGSWGYEPVYGAVWYPRVDVGWRPYYNGRWSFYGSFGWTWIGGPRWAWPTHHYGRWGYSNKWYWIPGRRWAPAYVSWGYYPGYVSWCPQGYYGYPVYPITHATYFTVQPWTAWTVVPSRSFVHDFRPAHYAVAQPTVAQPVWSQFATRNAGPVGPVNLATSRTAPLRSPTYVNQAVPRDGVVSTGSGVAASRGTAVPRTASTPASSTTQFRPGVDADGTTRVRPDGAAAGRVAPSNAAAYQPDRPTVPMRSRQVIPDTPDETPERAGPSRSIMSETPLTTAPFTRAVGAERNRPGTVPGAVDRPVMGSPEMNAAPDRTPSRLPGFYREDPRGTAVPRQALPQAGPPQPAPAAATGGVPRRTAPGGPPPPPPSAPSSSTPSRTRPAPPPPASAPAAPSAAAPSSGPGRTAPAGSATTGRAVSRGGGGR